MILKNISKGIINLAGRLIDPKQSIFVNREMIAKYEGMIEMYYASKKAVVLEGEKELTLENVRKIITSSSKEEVKEDDNKVDNYLDIAKDTLKQTTEEKAVAEEKAVVEKVTEENEEKATDEAPKKASTTRGGRKTSATGNKK